MSDLLSPIQSISIPVQENLSRAMNNAVNLKQESGGTGAGQVKPYEKVAEEMESLFAYQMLKVMRECSKSMSAEKKGMGDETYMSLFDMEVSRLVADRGLGLKEAIISWLERSQSAQHNEIIHDTNKS
jgi:Rod binding domain-containing protein